MEKSGARLAWEHFYPNEPLPWPLRHVEDQDLWRFALPATRAFVQGKIVRLANGPPVMSVNSRS